jgi:hypothetical protein
MKSERIEVLVLPVDGPIVVREIANGLDAFQALVGGYIQAVILRGQLRGTLYLDEEGKLNDPPKARNHVATHMAYLMPGDYIAGDAFISGPLDREGCDTSVEQRVLDVVSGLVGFAVPREAETEQARRI